MRILSESPEAVNEVCTVLHTGGIVIHATETCYGIACDLTNPDAVRKLFAIKKRPDDQPVSALFSSLDQASSFVDVSTRALVLAKKYLPGPLTLVLPTKTNAPLQIFVCPPPLSPIPYHLSPTIGVRISSHPCAIQIAHAFGKPIATTSANIHGEPNPYAIDDLVVAFGIADAKPDLILDSGTLPIAPPSTVIEIIGNTLKVLRQGELHVE